MLFFCWCWRDYSWILVQLFLNMCVYMCVFLLMLKTPSLKRTCWPCPPSNAGGTLTSALSSMRRRRCQNICRMLASCSMDALASTLRPEQHQDVSVGCVCSYWAFSLFLRGLRQSGCLPGKRWCASIGIIVLSLYWHSGISVDVLSLCWHSSVSVDVLSLYWHSSISFDVFSLYRHQN